MPTAAVFIAPADAGDGFDPQRRLFEQSIEHTPGKCTREPPPCKARFTRTGSHSVSIIVVPSEMKQRPIQADPAAFGLDLPYDRRSSANRLPPVAAPSR